MSLPGKTAECIRPPFWHPWGGGAHHVKTSYPGEYRGGIYMASTVAESCALYDTVLHPEGCGTDVVGSGDLERFRSLLDEIVPSARPRAGELFWMTDATPHESLTLTKRQYRQFFRLVTSEVGVWWARHSSPNPLGVRPPAGTVILTHDKFTGEEGGEDELTEHHDIRHRHSHARGARLASRRICSLM